MKPIPPEHLLRWMALHAVSDWSIGQDAQQWLLSLTSDEVRAALAQLAALPFEQARIQFHEQAYKRR